MPRLYKLFCVALLLWVAPYSFAQQNTADDLTKDSLGLAIGALLGYTLQDIGFYAKHINTTQFAESFEAAYRGNSTMPDTLARQRFQMAVVAVQNSQEEAVVHPQFSEAFAILVAPGFAQNGILIEDVNMDFLQRSLQSVWTDKPLLTKLDAERIFLKHPKILLKQQEIEAENEKKAQAGVDFLEANKKKKGVITTSSGLQYQIIKKGKKKAKKPTLANSVRVHYHGTLIDGTVFDSSVERGETIEFPLEQVILGWQEGVALMPVGSKFKFFIPHNLAYGDAGTAEIPPYSVLIFEVELFEITN